MHFNTLEAYLAFENQLRSFGQEPTAEMLSEKARLEELANPNQAEYIFSTMKAHNPFMNPEKEKCVRDMTEELLREGDDASQPCLLLGKVQCGKTDTFLSIMGLCFDRGIDVAVVFTKGTTTLTKQTLERLTKDFRHFADNGTYGQKVIIGVYDILDLHRRGYLTDYQLNDPARKYIIVCKKENTNLTYLNEMFEQNEILRNKKVLVVDDEADFASRAYLKRKNELSLLKIAENIEKFITLPHFCRYLQVTATPYSLYLQPDGTVRLRNNKEATTWLPRYTGIVPIHDKYVGGREYFVLSEDENSMYSYLYEPVDPMCLGILGARNEWYLDQAGHRENLKDLNYAVICYFFAAAIRSIQLRRTKNEKYRSSCLIHCEIAQRNHKWQEDLIVSIIEDIKKAILDQSNSDLHILDMESRAFESFKMSHDLAVAEGLINEKFPTFTEIEGKVKEMLQYNDYTVNVVNSEEPGRVTTMLDDKGQLRLEQSCNFFIGGSILDRGITISNMLCFFYGRDPGKFQMDTVLQHARMYGPRSKEDMACTRFFTTEEIYDVLKTINAFDDVLRAYLISHGNSVRSNDFTSVIIGFDNRIKPSAANKYTPANTLVIKPHMRRLPYGFQTGTAAEITETVNKIDEIIATSPNYHDKDENGYFLMSYQEAVDIVKKIGATFVYGEEYNNLGMEWDTNEFLTILDNLTYNSPDELIWVRQIVNRNMSRERADINDRRGRFVDSPLDARENSLDKDQAQSRPVLDLIRQNGLAENGWRDTPFYWPVLVTPQQMRAGIFTINSNKKAKKLRKEIFLETLDNYPKEQILKLPIERFPMFDILLGTKFEERRPIADLTAPRFLAKDESGSYILVDGCDPTKYYPLSAYNNGVFPFKIREYKYLYLTDARDNSGSKVLVELKQDPSYVLESEAITQEDIIYTKFGIGNEATDETQCYWNIYYQLGRVLEFKFNEQDAEIYREYQIEIERARLEDAQADESNG